MKRNGNKVHISASNLALSGLLILAITIVIQEMEEEDRLWQAKARRRQQKEALRKAEREEEEKVVDSKPPPAGNATKGAPTDVGEGALSPARKAPRFY